MINNNNHQLDQPVITCITSPPPLFRKLLFCMFSLFNFSSIFPGGGSADPICLLCAYAHEHLCLDNCPPKLPLLSYATARSRGREFDPRPGRLLNYSGQVVHTHVPKQYNLVYRRKLEIHSLARYTVQSKAELK